MNRKINIPEYEVSEFNKAFKDVIQDNFDYISERKLFAWARRKEEDNPPAP